MVIVEKSFPRGGVTTTKTNETKPKENIIFGTLQKKVKRPKADVANKTQEDSEANLTPKTAELLNYETVQEGMLLMGIVSSVEELFVNISLPGRMKARVSALEISNAYYKMTKEFVDKTSSSDQYKPLNYLFSVGQIVYGCVQEVLNLEHGAKQIKFSLKPSETHKDLSHLSVKKSFLFTGAIEEIQEHGYIIESGIKGMRTFLPLEKSKETQNHFIGQLLYLKVEKVTHDKAVTTSICKEVEGNNFSIKNHAEPNLDYIMPSTILQFKISNILKNGLQGTIMNESVTAYVNEHQLTDALSLPDDYEKDSIHKARVLYVMPLTKLVYLTLNLRKDKKEEVSEDSEESVKDYRRGTVITNAKVHHLGTGGIVVILDNKHKGLISYKSIKAPFKGNYDQDELLMKYTRKTKLTVRVLGHDIMDSLYICTDDPSIVNETYFSFDDIEIGDFVTAVVDSKEDKAGGLFVKLGKIKGYIDKLYLNGKFSENAKIRCRIVAVNFDRHTIYLTNRPEYMQKTCKILKSPEEAKVNRSFMGTIVKCGPLFICVKFFNNIQGTLSRKDLKNSNYFEGQTMNFRISEIKNEQIRLGLPETIFHFGEICPVTVGNKLDSGLEVKIKYHEKNKSSDDDDDDDESDKEEDTSQEFIGFIPSHNLSDFSDLQLAHYQAITDGSEIKAACVSRNTFSLRDVSYFEGLAVADWQSVKPGDILRAYIKNILEDDVVELMLPLNNYDKLIKVHWKMLILNAFEKANITLVPEQVLYAKILSKEISTKTLTVSAKLTDVWDGSLKNTAKYLEKYLEELDNIKQSLMKQKKSIANYEIGQKIKVKFEEIHEETKDWIYSFPEGDITGIVKSSIVRKTIPPKKGKEQECIILWIDYSYNILYLSNKREDIVHIKQAAALPENLVNKNGINAKVLLKLDNLLVLSMKKPDNPIVFVPMRLHYNDLENSVGINLLEGELYKIAFIHESLPIAVPDDIWKLWKDKFGKRPAETLKETPSKKRKVEVNNEVKYPIKEETREKLNLKKKEEKSNEANPPKKSRKSSDSENAKLKDPKKSKRNDSIGSEKSITEASDDGNGETLGFFIDKKPNNSNDKSPKLTKKIEKPVEKLIGINDFWSTSINDTLNNENIESSSSEDDDDEEGKADNKKKKKLTAAEKFKQNREAENRLREIEEKYADPKAIPETVDQFERLVISEPNNSKNWINFMVFHLQAAEIEKAKAVGQRAIKTINFRQTEDLLNIWAALLNLDLRYGNKDDFENTLKEALACNDPIKVHLRAVEILCNAKKNQELIELLNIITKKYKANPEAWKAVANAYFEIQMPEKAQQMLHRALACLPERDHVNTIVHFANMNHKYGLKDMAHTLFEQVLTSYPKRVDIWSQYTDVLIKDDLLDQARALLDRASLEKIPLKKMRTIFKKMLEIEQRFGKPEDVERVKSKAADFVKAHL